MVSRIERWIPPLRAGRRSAGQALLAWLDDPRAPRVCLVSGSAAVGKTHLLTWLATTCSDPATSPRQRPDAALSLAGLSIDGATWTIAARLGVHARTPAELASKLRTSERPWLLFLWDLDRSVDAKATARDLLAPLLAVPGLRAVIESDSDLPEADQSAVLALDEPRWTDAQAFANWYNQRRGESPFSAEQVYPSRPGPAGRQDPRRRRRADCGWPGRA